MTKTNKFAPGPWHFCPVRKQVRDSKGLLLFDSPRRPDESPNGELGAAAPELLGALEALLDYLEDTGVDLNDNGAECRAAIAKATGDKGKPESGKQYRLTGPGSIAEGKTWAEAEEK